MKKLISLFACMLMLGSGAVFAENNVVEPATVEEAFEGVWVEFEEGFQLYLPAEWLEVEVTDEQAGNGVIYSAASEDGAQSFQLTWAAREAETTIEDLQSELVADYADAEIVATETAALVHYTDTENDMSVYVMLDEANTGVYTFSFCPASDVELSETIEWIAASISPVEQDEIGEAVDGETEEAAEIDESVEEETGEENAE